MDCNDSDALKHLTYDQITPIAGGVTITPQLPAATLRHNMQIAGPSSPGQNIPPHLIRSICHRVCMSRMQVMVQQLHAITINDSLIMIHCPKQTGLLDWSRGIMIRITTFTLTCLRRHYQQ